MQRKLKYVQLGAASGKVWTGLLHFWDLHIRTVTCTCLQVHWNTAMPVLMLVMYLVNVMNE